MKNLTRYDLVDDAYLSKEMATSSCGEWVKFSDIKELLQTAHNKPIPKLPTLEEVYTSVQCGPYRELSYRECHVLDACYEFIGRQLSA